MGIRGPLLSSLLQFFVHSLSFLIPVLGIALGYFQDLKNHDSSPETKHSLPPVDKKNCTCSCWDGLSKGRYHHPLPAYMSIYFNSEIETLMLLFLAYWYFSLFASVLSRISKLLMERRLEFVITPILALSCYAHIYGGWCLFNYLNQRYYLMWYSQIFFCLSELPITYVLFRLLDKEELRSNSVVSYRSAAMILTTFCLLHISLGLKEKILWFFLVPGYSGVTKNRDLGLMGGDILGVIYGIYLWKSKVEYSSAYQFQKDLCVVVTLFLGLWGFYQLSSSFDYPAEWATDVSSNTQ